MQGTGRAFVELNPASPPRPPPSLCSLGITIELQGLESDSSSRAEAQTLLGTCCSACPGEPVGLEVVGCHAQARQPGRAVNVSIGS